MVGGDFVFCFAPNEIVVCFAIIISCRGSKNRNTIVELQKREKKVSKKLGNISPAFAWSKEFSVTEKHVVIAY